MKRLPLLFAITIFLASCGDDYICQKDPLFPAFINYSIQEIDTIFLEVYQKGTSTLLNTIRLDKGNSWFIPAGDTAKMFMIRGNDWPTDEFDYRFINPADNKTVSITDLQYSIKEGHRGGLFGWDGPACNSPLISYKRDGVLVTITGSPPDNSYVYIRK